MSSSKTEISYRVFWRKCKTLQLSSTVRIAERTDQSRQLTIPCHGNRKLQHFRYLFGSVVKRDECFLSCTWNMDADHLPFIVLSQQVFTYYLHMNTYILMLDVDTMRYFVSASIRLGWTVDSKRPLNIWSCSH